MPVGKLPEQIIQQMAALYLAHFDGSSEALFRADLAEKDEAILLFAGAELAGFTTLKTYTAPWQGRTIRLVYSGDTIVAPAHWGQQALAFAWISRIGQVKRQMPELPLYWFLLVKGHRTYKYLSVFGKSFHPHWAQPRTDLQALANHLARARFGPDFDADSGLVRFAASRGHLKQEIADATPEELSKPATRFFLERNPDYRLGHELVCLCELEPDNMKPLTARIFHKAYDTNEAATP